MTFDHNRERNTMKRKNGYYWVRLRGSRKLQIAELCKMKNTDLHWQLVGVTLWLRDDRFSYISSTPIHKPTSK